MKQKFNTSFTDITLWNKRNFVNTGGTRAKFVALNEEGEMFYFKGAKETKDGGIRYPLEFWSEIISSKIGQILGFEMLDYNIGYDLNHLQKIGCLSKSMIDEKKERLTEGITYLSGYSSEYNPEKDKKKYTFQFIKDTLDHHKIGDHINHIIDTIIFDAIVGNSDRHQENWGFIRKYIELSINKNIAEQINFANKNFIINKIKTFINKISIFKKIQKDKYIKEEVRISINFKNSTRYSPIYDSGCCLAREKTEEEIIKMNNNIELIENYIKRGKSEIHWDEKKITHFQLIENIIINYEEIVKKRINIIRKKFNHDLITELVNNIDNDLPTHCFKYKLTKERKEVIIKILNLRIEKILNLI